MEWAEQAVVERARSGDGEAFRELVERHSRPLFRLAYRMTGSESDAEDVVQETFLKAYRQLARFDGRASFGTWLHRIAANCAPTIKTRPSLALAGQGGPSFAAGTAGTSS